jgi:CHAT domain-containing protein
MLVSLLAGSAGVTALRAQAAQPDPAYLEARRLADLGGAALRLRDHVAAARHFEGILELAVDPADRSHRSIRTWALRELLRLSIRVEDPERVQRYLPEYRQLAGLAAAGLLQAEWLLRIGMLRDAAELLAVVGREFLSPQQRSEWRVLQIEEFLASEQFERAIALADEITGNPVDNQSVELVRVKLSRAFAWARSGRGAEARAALEALREEPKAMAGYGGRICAELALSRLADGDEAGAAAVLASIGEVLLARADAWWLLAKTRLALVRRERDSSATSELIELREELRQRHQRMLRNWLTMPELSSGVAFLQWSARREQLVCLCLLEHAIDGAAALPRCFDYLLAADACGSLARLRNLKAGDFADLQARSLRHGGALAWFLPAPHGSLVLVATTTGAELVPLPPDQQLRNQVTALRNALVDHMRLGPDWMEPLQSMRKPLADWLFQPRMRQLLQNNLRWVVLGRELLTGMQLEYLPQLDDSNGWLGHTHAIEYVPSASLALSAAPTIVAETAPRMALLAAETLQPEVRQRYPQPDLPLASAHLQRLADAVDPASVQIACGLGITGLQATLREADYLVVFAHGQRRHRDDGWDEESLRYRPLGVLLSDGFFGAEHLERGSSAPWLVALASCGTARAGVDRGEDGQMFGTAWLAAGTRCVLAAEADLELVATQHLLRAMLYELVSSNEPAEALRKARVVVAGMPGFGHPALHCALRLDSTLPPFLRPPHPRAAFGLLWWGGMAGLAVLAGLGMRLVLRMRRNQGRT